MKKLFLLTSILTLIFFTDCSHNSNENNTTRKESFKSCSIYHYNYQNGNIDENSKILIKTLKFDEKGNKIEEMKFNSQGVNYENTFYKYDAQGNLIDVVVYSYDRAIEEKTSFKYDNNGNLIEEIKFKPKEPIEKLEYIYSK